MLKRDDKLEALWRMKEQSQKNASLRLDGLKKQMDHNQQSLKKLLVYQQEYMQQFNSMKQSNITQALIHYFSHFLQQLEHAISLHQMQIILLKHEWQLQKKQCETRKKESKAILKVLKWAD